MSIDLIPRSRLKWIPTRWKFAHSYCFFLHDECVRVLKEYEDARAHLVTVNFKSKIDAEEFGRLAKEDLTEALLRTGYPRQARRMVINSITMAMASDCLHHIFEALKCFEKRKIIVGFNLLRKPLKQNLLYLAWMVSDERGFFAEFMSGNPKKLTQKTLGNRRQEIFARAIAEMPVGAPFMPEVLEAVIYDRRSNFGFEKLFEHAVHLITAEQIELRTEPQNFNFIFKNFSDDDTYDALYRWLPYILLFVAHTIFVLFNRMRSMDKGTETAFAVRSLFAYALMQGGQGCQLALKELNGMLAGVICGHCKAALNVTLYNAEKILLTDSFRCAKCRNVTPLPFSWSF